MSRACVLLGVAALAWALSSSVMARVVIMDSDAPALESNLRSAYLLRETHADVAAISCGPDERQIRLVRHFDQVLELLAAKNRLSLELALNRLQGHRGEEWSAAQKAEWRRVLAWRR